MCTAATYKTKDFYFGRTLDYEFSYGDEVVITPRNYPFHFRHIDAIESHYAMIGMAHVVEMTLCIMMHSMNVDWQWLGLILLEMQHIMI